MWTEIIVVICIVLAYIRFFKQVAEEEKKYKRVRQLDDNNATNSVNSFRD